MTDHAPNTFMPTQATLSRRQARWSEFLQRFKTLEWHYKPGRINVAEPVARIACKCFCGCARPEAGVLDTVEPSVSDPGLAVEDFIERQLEQFVDFADKAEAAPENWEVVWDPACWADPEPIAKGLAKRWVGGGRNGPARVGRLACSSMCTCRGAALLYPEGPDAFVHNFDKFLGGVFAAEHTVSSEMDQSDWQIHPRIFFQYNAELGPYDVDAACDPQGRNAFVPEYWTAKDDLTQQDWAHQKTWCNVPFHLAFEAPQRFLVCKESSPDDTAATFFIPAWPGTPAWNLAMRTFQLVDYYPPYSDLFTATPEKAGEAQRALGPVKFPVAVITCPAGPIRRDDASFAKFKSVPAWRHENQSKAVEVETAGRHDGRNAEEVPRVVQSPRTGVCEFKHGPGLLHDWRPQDQYRRCASCTAANLQAFKAGSRLHQ